MTYREVKKNFKKTTALLKTFFYVSSLQFGPHYRKSTSVGIFKVYWFSLLHLRGSKYKIPNLMSFTEKMGAGSVQCGREAWSETAVLRNV